MRILGIDFGDKTIGLAVSDKLLLISQGLGHYRTVNREEDLKYFKNLAAKFEISEIVIGFPLRMDGSEGTRAEKTKEFANWLEKELGLPIILWDERLTTQQALKILRGQKIKGKTKKNLIDQISATIILSSYLESRKQKSNGP
ncbi:MAG: Holliday junction resolvase RuvX [Candidatus Aminicenantaceae bacterium]